MPGKLAALVRAKYPDAYSDMDDATLEAAVLKAHPEYADLAGDQQPEGPSKPEEPGTNAGLGLFAAGKLTPVAARTATAFAESPAVPKTAGAIARGLTTLGGVGYGAATGNMAQVLAAPREGWLAGKGGYFLGKGAQSLAQPVAGLLSRLAPYAQSLSTLGATQGVGDLAQMAEPNRRDIGAMGIGPSVNVPGQQPALLNMLFEKIKAMSGQ